MGGSLAKQILQVLDSNFTKSCIVVKLKTVNPILNLELLPQSYEALSIDQREATPVQKRHHRFVYHSDGA